MANYIRFIFFSIVVFTSVSLFGQIPVDGTPYGVHNKKRGDKNIPVYVYSLPENFVIHNSNKNLPFDFAYTFYDSLNFDNAALWDTLNDNRRVGRLIIVSPKAKSLNIIFSKFNVPKSGKLFLYDSKMNMVLGAFSNHNVSKSGIFAVSPVAGDTLIIEYSEPLDVPVKGSLIIDRINHDYIGIVKSSDEVNNSDVANCNVDINCEEGRDWQTEKRAVCKILYNGSSHCTGTLINNTSNNQIPYIITAHHCIHDPQVAATAIFYFNDEHVECGGTTLDTKYSISGADLVATDSLGHLDFCLMRLSRVPPKYFNVYYAGWTINPTAPDSGICIHHPSNDVKRISGENDALVQGSFTEFAYLPDKHWKINRWDFGTTLAGSSGAPLFDPENHLIVGTLTGGQANCKDPINDYFAQFFREWNEYPKPSAQLKYWLAPNNNSSEFCLGLDPKLFSKEMVSNVAFEEKIGIAPFFDSYNSSVAIKSSSLIPVDAVAEKFTGVGVKKLYALSLPFYISDIEKLSEVSLNIWDGISLPDSILYRISLSPQYVSKVIPDSKWLYIVLKEPIIVEGNFFVGIEYDQHTSDFSLYAVNDRVNKYNSIYFSEDDKWQSLSNEMIYSSLAIDVLLMDSIIAVTDTTFQYSDFLYNIDFKKNTDYELFTIFPNPIKNMMFISLNEELSNNKDIEISIISILGQEMGKFHYYDNTLSLFSLDLGYLKQGLYIISVKSEYMNIKKMIFKE